MKQITSPRRASKGVSSEAIQAPSQGGPAGAEFQAVMGLDVGDKQTHFCMLDQIGRAHV